MERTSSNNGEQSQRQLTEQKCVLGFLYLTVLTRVSNTSEYVQYFYHHGDPHLVVLAPSPGSRSVEAEENEGILATDDEEDGEELQVWDKIANTPEERNQATGVLLVWLDTVTKHAEGTKNGSS